MCRWRRLGRVHTLVNYIIGYCKISRILCVSYLNSHNWQMHFSNIPTYTPGAWRLTRYTNLMELACYCVILWHIHVIFTCVCKRFKSSSLKYLQHNNSVVWVCFVMNDSRIYVLSAELPTTSINRMWIAEKKGEDNISGSCV